MCNEGYRYSYGAESADLGQSQCLGERHSQKGGNIVELVTADGSDEFDDGADFEL